MIALVALASAVGLVAGDPDGVSVRPGLLVNASLGASSASEWGPALALSRVRPVLRGTLDGPRATYFVQAELVGSPALLDAQLDLSPLEGVTVRSGRFLVPFSRAQTTPVPLLQFQTFSASTAAMSHGRDLGLAVDLRRTGPVHGTLGVFEGASSADAVHPLAAAHVDADLVGHASWDEIQAMREPDGAPSWSVGAGLLAGHQVRDPDVDALDATTLGVDTAVRAGRFRAQAEGFWRRWKDATVDLGATAQASVVVSPRVELAARGDVLDLTGARAWTGEGLAQLHLADSHLRLALSGRVRRAGDSRDLAVAILEQAWF